MLRNAEIKETKGGEKMEFLMTKKCLNLLLKFFVSGRKKSLQSFVAAAVILEGFWWMNEATSH